VRIVHHDTSIIKLQEAAMAKNKILRILLLLPASLFLMANVRPGRMGLGLFVCIMLFVIVLLIFVFVSEHIKKNHTGNLTPIPQKDYIELKVPLPSLPQNKNMVNEIVGSLPPDKKNCTLCSCRTCDDFVKWFAVGQQIPLDHCPYVPENIQKKYRLESDNIKRKLHERPHMGLLNAIWNSLPEDKRNCLSCGYNCYSFFNKVYLRKFTLDSCPHVPQATRKKYHYLYQQV
jgi:ArsR family metal-binding transcriptional regulator